MSDLIENPDDRVSGGAAQMKRSNQLPLFYLQQNKHGRPDLGFYQEDAIDPPVSIITRN